MTDDDYGRRNAMRFFIGQRVRPTAAGRAAFPKMISGRVMELKDGEVGVHQYGYPREACTVLFPQDFFEPDPYYPPNHHVDALRYAHESLPRVAAAMTRVRRRLTEINQIVTAPAKIEAAPRVVDADRLGARWAEDLEPMSTAESEAWSAALRARVQESEWQDREREIRSLGWDPEPDDAPAWGWATPSPRERRASVAAAQAAFLAWAASAASAPLLVSGFVERLEAIENATHSMAEFIKAVVPLTEWLDVQPRRRELHAAAQGVWLRVRRRAGIIR